MTHRRYNCICLQIFVIVGLSHLPSYSDDWPMFGRDATHNPVSPETNPPLDWKVGTGDRRTGGLTEPGRNIKWTAKLGSFTCGDPVVADGLIWIGTNNFWGTEFETREDASVLACFRESDGKLLYRCVSPRLSSGYVNDWPHSSMASSPLIERNRLWFVTNRAEVVCWDIAPLKRGEREPREVWKLDMIKELGVFPKGSVMHLTRCCSVASYKDYIYVITGNGVDNSWVNLPNPNAPSLICVKKHDGTVVWSDNSAGVNVLSGQWSSPLVIEIGGRAQVVTPQGDGWIRSFDAISGEKVWKFDINHKTTKWMLGGAGSRNNILAAPVFYDGRVYIASGQNASHGEGPGRLCCIDPTGRGDISQELAVDSDDNSIPHERIQAVHPEQGEQAVPNPNSGLIWEYTQEDGNGDGEIQFEEKFDRSVSSVAIKNGLLIAVDFSGLVHCFDAETGELFWNHDVLAQCFAAPLIVDDVVYVADDDGDVSIFRLSADPLIAMRNGQPVNVKDGLEGEVTNMGSSVFTSPIFVGGTLYVANRSRLFAIQANTGEPDAVARASRRWPQRRDTNRDDVVSEIGSLKKRSKESGSKRERRGPRAVFVPTPQDVVEKMLEIAGVTKDDVVYDLGSGDGRIVITAAKKYGARSVGIEIDRELVELSQAKAEQAGVVDWVEFRREDIFDVDLSEATVITAYLLPAQLQRLIPKLQAMKAGSRVVAHYFAIPGVKPHQELIVESKESGEQHKIYVWTTPIGRRE